MLKVVLAHDFDVVFLVKIKAELVFSPLVRVDDHGCFCGTWGHIDEVMEDYSAVCKEAQHAPEIDVELHLAVFAAGFGALFVPDSSVGAEELLEEFFVEIVELVPPVGNLSVS